MERLTDEMSAGNYGVLNCGANCKYDNKYCYTHNCPEIERAIQKLGEYEDAEEQGLLLRLPCKVGERLFVIWNAKGHWRIVPVDVKEISLGIYMTMKTVQIKVEQISGRGRLFNFYNNDFGEVIFRSREEAEKKLKEMEDKNETSRK